MIKAHDELVLVHPVGIGGGGSAVTVEAAAGGATVLAASTAPRRATANAAHDSGESTGAFGLPPPSRSAKATVPKPSVAGAGSAMAAAGGAGGGTENCIGAVGAGAGDGTEMATGAAMLEESATDTVAREGMERVGARESRSVAAAVARAGGRTRVAALAAGALSGRSLVVAGAEALGPRCRGVLTALER